MGSSRRCYNRDYLKTDMVLASFVGYGADLGQEGDALTLQDSYFVNHWWDMIQPLLPAPATGGVGSGCKGQPGLTSYRGSSRPWSQRRRRLPRCGQHGRRQCLHKSLWSHNKGRPVTTWGRRQNVRPNRGMAVGQHETNQIGKRHRNPFLHLTRPWDSWVVLPQTYEEKTPLRPRTSLDGGGSVPGLGGLAIAGCHDARAATRISLQSGRSSLPARLSSEPTTVA